MWQTEASVIITKSLPSHLVPRRAVVKVRLLLRLRSHLLCPSVVEQCICYRIQADEMVLEWVAYSTTKNGLKLTMDTLEQFEHEVTGSYFLK